MVQKSIQKTGRVFIVVLLSMAFLIISVLYLYNVHYHTPNLNKSITLFENLIPLLFLVSVIPLVFVFKNIKQTSFLFFFLFVISNFCISTLKICEFFAPTEKLCIIIGNVTYAFIALVSIFWLIFVLKWTSHSLYNYKVLFILLFFIPVLTIIFKIFNSTFFLIWKANHFEKIDNYLVNIIDEYGPWFYVHAIYSYGTYFLGCIILLKENKFLWNYYKLRSFILVIGVVLPISINVLYVFRDVNGFFFDYSSCTLSIAALFFTIIMTKFKIFSIPQPSSTLIQNSLDIGIIVITSQGIIIQINSSAISQFGEETLMGKSITDFITFSNLEAFNNCLLKQEKSEFIGYCNDKTLRINVKPQPTHNDTQLFTILTEQYNVPSEKPKLETDESLFEGIYKKAVNAQLSSRELDVLNELLTTKTKKEIAEFLNISPETIHTHTTHILKKLNCKNRQELRSIAHKGNLNRL